MKKIMTVAALATWGLTASAQSEWYKNIKVGGYVIG